MKKIWLCCAALAFLGLMGFAGSSTLGGLTPVGDDDAAQLTGGQCQVRYWATVCTGCGGTSSCPYNQPPPPAPRRPCYWVYSAVPCTSACNYPTNGPTNQALSTFPCYDCGQSYLQCGSYYSWTYCSP
jgi:hypothetical protein